MKTPIKTASDKLKQEKAEHGLTKQLLKIILFRYLANENDFAAIGPDEIKSAMNLELKSEEQNGLLYIRLRTRN